MTIDIATLGIKVESLEAKLAALELEKLEKQGRATSKSINTLEKESKLLSEGMKALGGVLAGVSFVAFAKNAIDTLDALNDLSLKTGILASDLAGMSLAAKQSGTSLDAFAFGLNKLSVDMAQNSAAFKQLGIDAKSPLEAFLQLASVLDGITEPQLKAAVATQALGRGWLELAPLLANGAAGLRETIAKGREMSGVTDQMTKDADAFNDQLEEMTGWLGSLGVRLIGPVLDGFNQLANQIRNTTADGITFINVLKGISNFAQGIPNLKGTAGELAAVNQEIARYERVGSMLGGVLQSDKAKANLNDLYEKQIKLVNKLKTETESLNVETEKIPIATLKDFAGAHESAGKATEKHTKAAKAHTAEVSAQGQAYSALQSQYDSMVEALARESALKGDNSRLAALKYDLEAGALSKLTEAQKLYLLQTTSEIENARINAKIAEDKKTEMDQLIDRYNQLTLSAREYYQLQLTGKGIAPDQQGDLLAQYDKNAGIERANAEVDAGIAKLESYTSSINETSNAWADMGETATEATDRTLGGINKVIGITKNYIKQISDIGKRQMENESRAKNIEYLYPSPKRTKEIENYYKIKDELDAESLAASMTAIRQVTQAQANMYEEGTAAANIAKVANLAAIAAEFAAQWQLLTVRAAAAIANQGGGDTYTAFARIAAMMALMGSVISAAGGSSSFSGISGTPPTGTKTTGTTLGGGKDDQSESATNIADLLKDIHAEEYIELRGINKGVAALSDAITGAITGIFRFGGLKDFKVPGLGTKLTVSAKGTQALAGFGVGELVSQLLFGKTKKSVVGGGIEAAATQMNEILEGAMIDMRQYLTIETKKSGGLFGKKSVKYSTKYGPLDDDISMGITRIFESAGEVMIEAANALGDGLAERVRDYIIPSFQIELRGLNAEDAVKKVNDLVSALLDQMSETVFGDIIGEYQKLGEGMLETAIRIVAQMAVVRDALNESGLSMANNAIFISDALIAAAGGIEEFQEQFSDFYDSFYTAGEQQDRLGQKLGDQLSEVWGPSAIAYLAQSREAYRGLLEQVNLDTELGRDRYSMMLRLADAADEYYSAIEQGEAARAELAAQKRSLDIELMEAQGKTAQALAESRKDELAAMDASLRATKQAIWAANDLAQARDAERAAADQAKQALEAYNTQKRSLEIKLMEARSDTAGATAAKRADELSALPAGLRDIQKAIYATLDAQNEQKINLAEMIDNGTALLEELKKIRATTSVWTTASAFNDKYAADTATAEKQIADMASASALSIQNAEGKIRYYQNDNVINPIKYAIINAIVEASGTVGTYVVSSSVDKLSRAMAESIARARYESRAPGLASVYAAQNDLADAMMTKTIGRLTYQGKVSIEYADAIATLNKRFKEGRITTDELSGTMTWLEKNLGKLSDHAKTAAEAMEEQARISLELANAGLSSINYYFGALGKQAEALAKAGAAANDTLSQTTSAIGRMASITSAFGDSAKAVMQNAGVAEYQASSGSATSKALLIAQAAAIAGQVITTQDAAQIAEKLAQAPAFAELDAIGIRDAALLLDGLRSFDAKSFENAFIRINNALAKNTVTESQYIALFNAALDTYENMDARVKEVTDKFQALRDAAKSLADQLLLNTSLTSLSGPQTAQEAQRQYQEALAKAQGGDIGDLQGITATMLELVKDNATTEVEYNRIFGRTIADIRGIENTPMPDIADRTSAPIVLELQALRAELAGLRSEQRIGNAQIASNTDKTVRRLDEFNVNGMPTVALT